MQAVATVLPAGEFEFAGHVKHVEESLAPIVAEYLPVSQGEHDDPSDDGNNPASQRHAAFCEDKAEFLMTIFESIHTPPQYSFHPPVGGTSAAVLELYIHTDVLPNVGPTYQ